MSIEEAEYILNEAVISEPSIMSYTYISSDEINKAIDKILEEREFQKNKIQKLEEEILKQREKDKNKIKIFNDKCFYDKYIKKLTRPVILLEN